MNAEQLARDIKSLDQAHKDANRVLSPQLGNSIGDKVKRLCLAAERSNNNISVECSQATHNQLNRVLPRSLNRLDVRVKELVDELLKLRQQGAHAAGHIHDLNKQLEALKAEQGEIRRKVAEALGKDALEIRALTTQEIVYMLIYRLGETKQGETNNSRLEEEDRLEIREKLITALGCGRFTSTVAMVDLVLGELQHTRAEAASDTAKNFNASILRLKAKADFEELKQEHQKLSEKHQELHSNYKLLQALSIGQPKGLAPEKEKWVATPSQCMADNSGLFRVMRGNEDATPHPVSKGIADAIAGELNARG
jgi:hypothetical protein